MYLTVVALICVRIYQQLQLSLYASVFVCALVISSVLVCVPISSFVCLCMYQSAFALICVHTYWQLHLSVCIPMRSCILSVYIPSGSSICLCMYCIYW
jgi:hypothetical protein